MSSSYEALRLLLEKYRDGTATRQDQIQLSLLLEEYSNDELYELFVSVYGTPDDFQEDAGRDLSWQEPMLRAIKAHPDFKQQAPVVRMPFYRRSVFRYAAAAVVLLVLGVTIYLLNQPSPHAALSIQFPSFETKEPCGLRLPAATKQDSIVNMYINDGIVTLSIPKCWQYMLTLADGSQVYLNASSSITYPLEFRAGDSVAVNVEGEAWFTIKDSSRKNFYVTAKGQTFSAPAGGSFNINAYKEQAIARIDTTNNPMWKQGYFAFNNATTQEAMEELARWYGWKVKYARENMAGNFDGLFCRNTPEATVLDYLKRSQLHFSKEGNQIIIQ